MWYEITYSFPNLRMDKYILSILYTGCNCIMLGVKLIHVSERNPCWTKNPRNIKQIPQSVINCVHDVTQWNGLLPLWHTFYQWHKPTSVVYWAKFTFVFYSVFNTMCWVEIWSVKRINYHVVTFFRVIHHSIPKIQVIFASIYSSIYH